MKEKEIHKRNQELEEKIQQLQRENEEYKSVLKNLRYNNSLYSESDVLNYIKYFEVLLNTTTDFVYFKDRNGRFLFCSQTLAEVSNQKHWKDMKGKTDVDVFPEHIGKEYQEDDLKVLNTGKPLLEKIDSYFDENGNKRFVETNKWPIIAANGDSVGLFGISRDVTDKLKVEHKIKENAKQLMELINTRDKLFSIIAHDLRNPFGMLVQMNELLSFKIDNNEIDDAKEILEISKESSKNVLNLLENLLQWSRIQTGNLMLTRSNFDLKESIYSVLGVLEVNYHNKNITITIEIEPKLSLNADKFMFETIVRNLLSNAIKYTNKEGQIRIKAFRQRKCIFVSVEDNGVGISENKLSKLFSIDEDLSTPGTEKEKGTGLGLLLCKEFIVLNDGKISVKSKENIGTTFTISFVQ